MLDGLYTLPNKPGSIVFEVSCGSESVPWNVEIKTKTCDNCVASRADEWLLAPKQNFVGSQRIELHHFQDKGSVSPAEVHFRIGSKTVQTYEFVKQRVDFDQSKLSALNWIETSTYEGDGERSSQAMQFYDLNAKPTQSLSRNMAAQKMIVSEVLYDEYARPQYATMPIPLDHQEMTFVEDFVNRDEDDYDDILNGEGGSQAVSYYSSSNPDAYVPADGKPMSKTIYSKTIPGAVTHSYGVGEVMSTKTAHSFTVNVAPNELLSHPLYAVGINIKSLKYEPGNLPGEADFTGMTKTVTRDVMGKESITYFDAQGNAVASCMSGNSDNLSVINAIYTIQLDANKHGYVDIHLPAHNPDEVTSYSLTMDGTWDYEIVNLLNEDTDRVTGTGGTRQRNDGFYRVMCTGNTSADAVTFNVDIAYKFYTFNAYDIAGRLLRSISPEHVERLVAGSLNASDIDDYVTRNTYNALGMLTRSISPDEGIVTVDNDADEGTHFKYFRDGRIRFSQNPQQRQDARFSYTHYDKFKRVIEVGQCDEIARYNAVATVSDVPMELSSSRCTDVTYTRYDEADLSMTGREQHFIWGRVSKTGNVNGNTWYSYNYDGTIAWVVQELFGFDADGDGIANYRDYTRVYGNFVDLDDLITIDYSYNFNGSVSEVCYRKEMDDEFTHLYKYDLNNNLSAVYTRAASESDWSLQARYEYYAHGSLKRLELGDGLQGVDYVYNINGWLKSINNPNGADPGGDDNDLFAMTLDYYNGDYYRNNKTINSTSPSNNYDGNIARQQWVNDGTGNVGSFPVSHLAYTYSYDERNYMAGARFSHLETGAPFSFNNFYDVYGDASGGPIQYDANGNIKGLIRDAYVKKEGTVNEYKKIILDNLSYDYTPIDADDKAFINRLYSVADAARYNQAEDMDNSNFTYNLIGQLTKDSYGHSDNGAGVGHKFTYNAYSKVTQILNNNNQLIGEYFYDDRGYRIKKIDNNGITTWYTRDISGNILATYYSDEDGDLHTEYPLYATGRIGIAKAKNNSIGHYAYELADHLGNVRATFRDGNGSPEVLSAADYYPFGLVMPGRMKETPDKYRFGYQGQFAEKDKETGYNQFEARLYDQRIGRWLIHDPAGQFWSPYATGNNPINFVDPDGREELDDDFIGPPNIDDWYYSDRYYNTDWFQYATENFFNNYDDSYSWVDAEWFTSTLNKYISNSWQMLDHGMFAASYGYELKPVEYFSEQISIQMQINHIKTYEVWIQSMYVRKGAKSFKFNQELGETNISTYSYHYRIYHEDTKPKLGTAIEFYDRNVFSPYKMGYFKYKPHTYFSWESYECTHGKGGLSMYKDVKLSDFGLSHY